MTESEKIQKAITDQGRKKIWVAEQLCISRPTLDRKLKNNSFKILELEKLRQLDLFYW